MKVISSTIAIGMLALFLNTQVYADDEVHKAKALEHAEEAVKHGKMGHHLQMLDEARESMEHAQAASNSGADGHMKQAIEHLEEAIKHAEMDRAGAATNHTQTAMEHMQESQSTH